MLKQVTLGLLVALAIGSGSDFINDANSDLTRGHALLFAPPAKILNAINNFIEEANEAQFRARRPS